MTQDEMRLAELNAMAELAATYRTAVVRASERIMSLRMDLVAQGLDRLLAAGLLADADAALDDLVALFDEPGVVSATAVVALAGEVRRFLTAARGMTPT